MGIRGRGNATLIVQPRRVERVKGAVVYANDGDPVTISHCDVQPLSSTERTEKGLVMTTLAQVYARTWAGDVSALVYFNGGEWEVVGQPQHLNHSPRTAYWAITIRKLGTAPT